MCKFSPVPGSGAHCPFYVQIEQVLGKSLDLSVSQLPHLLNRDNNRHFIGLPEELYEVSHDKNLDSAQHP